MALTLCVAHSAAAWWGGTKEVLRPRTSIGFPRILKDFLLDSVLDYLDFDLDLDSDLDFDSDLDPDLDLILDLDLV